MSARTVRRSTRVVKLVDAVKREDSASSEEEEDVKKVKRPIKKRKVVKSEDDIEDLAPPDNWQIQFEALREFRRNGPPAPVDTMGCDVHEHADPKTRRLHCLISLMLSAQCKDEANALVMAAMKRTLPRGFTLEDLLEISQEDLALLIRPAGMHNNKSKFIKRVAVILRDEYDGDIPDTPEAMMALPGVGPKMAMLCMSSAWDQIVGIGVDVHVHRISNLLGWVRTNAPEKTRAALETWLPRSYWREINHLMVGHGQMTCKPIGRRCSECPLSQQGPLLCPSVVVRENPRKKPRTVKTEDAGLLTPTSLSPSKQSYEARFPQRNIKVEIEVEVDQAQNLLDVLPTSQGTFGNDLDQLPEEQVAHFVSSPETSPYFMAAVKAEE